MFDTWGLDAAATLREVSAAPHGAGLGVSAGGGGRAVGRCASSGQPILGGAGAAGAGRAHRRWWNPIKAAEAQAKRCARKDARGLALTMYRSLSGGLSKRARVNTG